MPVSYPEYLRLDDLLSLQESSEDHDELLFIVIHQVYELWFKLILQELELLRDSLETDHPGQAMSTLGRIRTVMKTVVSQMDILETMTPVAFNAFRHRLEPASGFQSVQFREIEFRLGLRGEKRIALLGPGSPERARFDKLSGEPSLWDSFLRFLAARGWPIPESALERDLAEPVGEDPAVQEVLLEVYSRDPLMTALCERLVDLDEGLQEWRYRHVKMAERTIGAKIGTGGSAGAEYLRRTLFQPLFGDLWAIRNRL